MKTKNKAIDAKCYAFQPGEPILVDANVWLYLHPPAAQPTSRWADSYSGAFARMLQVKAKPIVDALILSEYLNRYVRLEFNAFWKTTYPEFKKFRQSDDGAKVLQYAVEELTQILKIAAPRDTRLADMNFPALLLAVRSGSIDFNDGLLIQSCRQNGWKLLTNDGDMSQGGIEVLTANSRLLQACS